MTNSSIVSYINSKAAAVQTCTQKGRSMQTIIQGEMICHLALTYRLLNIPRPITPRCRNNLLKKVTRLYSEMVLIQF